MARRPSKPPTTSPNKALVILLVFFVLTNIGTGVWVYAAYKEKDKWDNASKEKDKKLEEAKRTADWNRFQIYELLSAIGDPKFFEKTDAVKIARDGRKDFLESGAFKNEDGDVEFVATIKLL